MSAPPTLEPLAQADAGSAPVLIDELDAGPAQRLFDELEGLRIPRAATDLDIVDRVSMSTRRLGRGSLTAVTQTPILAPSICAICASNA